MPTGFRVFNQVTWALKSLHWLVIKFPINFRAFLLTFEDSNRISLRAQKLFGEEKVFDVTVLSLFCSSLFFNNVSTCIMLGWVMNMF